MYKGKKLRLTLIFVIIDFFSWKADAVLVKVLENASQGRSPEIKKILKLDRFEDPARRAPIISVKTNRYTVIITMGLIKAHKEPKTEPA